jgi:anaerobic selenocysteine-containing dehydrogenase
MHADDARALGLRDGDAVLLRSSSGQMRARVKLSPIKPRNVQVHWPEGNVLLAHSNCDPAAGVPVFKAIVTISPC